MAIALFDSGLGGLSVLAETRRLLPQHDLWYFADSGCMPYGPRSREWVQARSLAIGRLLHERGARLLAVPCNTACAAALDALRHVLPIPVVGIEPGVKPGVAATRSGVVAVLATSGTAASERYERLVARYARDLVVLTQPCHGLAEAIERGDPEGPAVRALIERYVPPLVARGADTLVLACTHYPLALGAIREVAGPAVTIVDTGPAVARQVALQAAAAGIGPGAGHLWPISTGDPAPLAALLKRLRLATSTPVELLLLPETSCASV